MLCAVVYFFNLQKKSAVMMARPTSRNFKSVHACLGFQVTADACIELPANLPQLNVYTRDLTITDRDPKSFSHVSLSIALCKHKALNAEWVTEPSLSVGTFI